MGGRRRTKMMESFGDLNTRSVDSLSELSRPGTSGSMSRFRQGLPSGSGARPGTIGRPSTTSKVTRRADSKDSGKFVMRGGFRMPKTQVPEELMTILTNPEPPPSEEGTSFPAVRSDPEL